ncbi:MAG TPA: hypothetical protein VGE60_10120 [Telluria sp.]
MRSLTRHHAENPELAEAIGSGRKGRMSLVLYLLGLALAFANPWIGFAVYIGVTLLWLIPDRRIEDRVFHE